MPWLRSAALLLAATLSPRAAPAQDGIPLCAGLTIAGSVSEPNGDYEPLITVEGVDADGVHLRYAAEVRSAMGTKRKFDVRRTVRRADLDTASLMAPWFDSRAALTIPGTTAIGASRKVLHALRTSGEARIGLFDAASTGYPARRDVQPNMYQFETPYTLRRAAGGHLTLPVLVNGVPARLPVVHARGEHLGDQAEFYFLDDDRNPLGLRFATTGIADDAAAVAQVVKISYRCPAGRPAQPAALTSRLEQSLLQTGRAEVYDVYFDFNSDRIREQSGPTLLEIAELLRRHPDWRLGIEGHTDSIAGDQFNLELSARRAAAVKTALTGRHGIAAGRLTTSGAGESRPKDRNDTPEGRARNRRVELVRLP